MLSLALCRSTDGDAYSKSTMTGFGHAGICLEPRSQIMGALEALNGDAIRFDDRVPVFRARGSLALTRAGWRLLNRLDCTGFVIMKKRPSRFCKAADS
jgi:hypothetical protein